MKTFKRLNLLGLALIGLALSAPAQLNWSATGNGVGGTNTAISAARVNQAPAVRAVDLTAATPTNVQLKFYNPFADAYVISATVTNSSTNIIISTAVSNQYFGNTYIVYWNNTNNTYTLLQSSNVHIGTNACTLANGSYAMVYIKSTDMAGPFKAANAGDKIWPVSVATAVASIPIHVAGAGQPTSTTLMGTNEFNGLVKQSLGGTGVPLFVGLAGRPVVVRIECAAAPSGIGASDAATNKIWSARGDFISP